MVGGEVLIQGLHRVNEGLLVHVFGDDGALGLHGGQQLVVLHAQGLGPLGGGLLGGGKDVGLQVGAQPLEQGVIDGQAVEVMEIYLANS